MLEETLFHSTLRKSYHYVRISASRSGSVTAHRARTERVKSTQTVRTAHESRGTVRAMKQFETRRKSRAAHERVNHRSKSCRKEPLTIIHANRERKARGRGERVFADPAVRGRAEIPAGREIRSVHSLHYRSAYRVAGGHCRLRRTTEPG